MQFKRNSLPGLHPNTRSKSGLTNTPGIVGANPAPSTPVLSTGRVGRVAASEKNARPLALVHARVSTSTKTTASADWTKAITGASSGVTSAITGGLSGAGGLGSVISGIASLFGGHKQTLPTLTPFTMSSSQNDSITISGGALTQSVESIQDQTAAIAQAVKSAILNSSTLNDVLSEI